MFSSRSVVDIVGFCCGCGVSARENHIMRMLDDSATFDGCKHVYHASCCEYLQKMLSLRPKDCPICQYPGDKHPYITKELTQYMWFNVDRLLDSNGRIKPRPHFSYMHIRNILRKAEQGMLLDFGGVTARDTKHRDIQLVSKNYMRIPITFDKRNDLIIPEQYLTPYLEQHDAMSSYLMCYIHGC
jgi:hypothetical protein